MRTGETSHAHDHARHLARAAPSGDRRESRESAGGTNRYARWSPIGSPHSCRCARAHISCVSGAPSAMHWPRTVSQPGSTLSSLNYSTASGASHTLDTRLEGQPSTPSRSLSFAFGTALPAPFQSLPGATRISSREGNSWRGRQKGRNFDTLRIYINQLRKIRGTTAWLRLIQQVGQRSCAAWPPSRHTASRNAANDCIGHSATLAGKPRGGRAPCARARSAGRCWTTTWPWGVSTITLCWCAASCCRRRTTGHKEVWSPGNKIASVGRRFCSRLGTARQSAQCGGAGACIGPKKKRNGKPKNGRARWRLARSVGIALTIKAAIAWVDDNNHSKYRAFIVRSIMLPLGGPPA
jgi:hypothetical protein